MKYDIIPAGTSRRALLGAGLAMPALITGARAQSAYPSRPIEVVTHSGVGGGTDITARMMMVQAPAELGTEFTVVNRTGGSGAAALAYAASRPKDGHTLLLITQTHLLTMARARSGPQLSDLIPIARATEDPQIVMVKAGSPLATAEGLLAAGRSRALKFGITHAGSVDHVTTVGFTKAAGLQAPTAVPFRSGGDIVINLVGGNIDVGLLNFSEAEAQFRAGEVKAPMVLADARSSSLPDAPTAKESGVNYSASTLRGFCLMKGTPEDRVEKLEQGLLRAMNGQIYRAYLASSGQSPDSVAGRGPWGAQLEEFARQGQETLAALGVMR
jgi:tripartite-type tricarboxylate transporter receptor subunit TctC